MTLASLSSLQLLAINRRAPTSDSGTAVETNSAATRPQLAAGPFRRRDPETGGVHVTVAVGIGVASILG
jgi:hypothetical protein